MSHLITNTQIANNTVPNKRSRYTFIDFAIELIDAAKAWLFWTAVALTGLLIVVSSIRGILKSF